MSYVITHDSFVMTFFYGKVHLGYLHLITEQLEISSEILVLFLL